MHSMTEMIRTLCRRFRTRLALIVATIAAMAPTLLHADVVTYYHNDLLGSPIAATNATGQVLWQERYGPYGDRQLLQPASANESVLFTSRHEDGNSELVYMGARYYDPMLGRFQSPDPSGFTGQDVQTFNRYAYANNNPYGFVDPNGKNPIIFWLFRATGAGYVAGVLADASSQAFAWGEIDWRMAMESSAARAGLEAGLANGLGLGYTAAGDAGVMALKLSQPSALQNANYAQTTFDNSFSSGGTFAGKTVQQVAEALRSGKMSPSEVEVQYIIRDGNALILNTRSAQALEQAGIRRAQWNAVNVTEDAAAQSRLSAQLRRNGLSSEGSPIVTPRN